MTLTKEQLTKAAQWWLKRMGTFQSTNMGSDNAMIGVLASLVDHRELPVDSQQFINAFTAYVEEKRPWGLSVDYGPAYHLRAIGEKCDMRRSWPFKHDMDFNWEAGTISAKAGYGQPYQFVA